MDGAVVIRRILSRQLADEAWYLGHTVPVACKPPIMEGDGNKEISEAETTIMLKGCGCSVEPISTLDALLNFKPSLCPCPPLLASHRAPPLSSSFAAYKLGLDGKPIKDGPRLIVCHDMKGGYLEDKFVCGTGNADNYVFRHWAQTDYFIYFSHHFVSCPPVGWTTAGHRNGSKVLGTIITEWKDGESICAGFLKEAETMDRVVKQLVLLTRHYAFDGYLLNIENPIEDTETLLTFIRLLHEGLRAASPANVLFYYDSVIMDGTLKWQNELNLNNKPFFDACDGIFLNYCWDDEKLEQSVNLAGERRTDVFVGVDVFGRNCYGGGGLNTDKALEKVSQHGLSAAIFAQGWSYECHPPCSWLETDNQLWGRSSRFLTYRAVDVSANGHGSKLLIETFFNLGFGRNRFFFGQKVDGGTEWFDLRETAYQPILLPQETGSEEGDIRCGGTYDQESGFLGGGSLRLSPSKSPALWLPLIFPLPRVSIPALLLFLAWKGDEVPCVTYRSRECNGSAPTGEVDIEDKYNNMVEVGLDELVREVSPPMDIRFKLGPAPGNTTCTRTLNGWNLTAYLFGRKLDEAQGGFCIGVETSPVNLGYMSLLAYPAL